jgi:hypothetical protein
MIAPQQRSAIDFTTRLICNVLDRLRENLTGPTFPIRMAR